MLYTVRLSSREMLIRLDPVSIGDEMDLHSLQSPQLNQLRPPSTLDQLC